MVPRLFLCLLACGLAGAGPGGDAVKKDMKKLQGVWKVIQAIDNGEKVPDEAIKTIVVTFKNDTVSVREEDTVKDRFTFKLDPSKKPKTIDMKHIEGNKKGDVDLGIYALEGDTLKVSVREQDGARPTEFGSKVGSLVFYVELKRMK